MTNESSTDTATRWHAFPNFRAKASHDRSPLRWPNMPLIYVYTCACACCNRCNRWATFFNCNWKTVCIRRARSAKEFFSASLAGSVSSMMLAESFACEKSNGFVAMRRNYGRALIDVTYRWQPEDSMTGALLSFTIPVYRYPYRLSDYFSLSLSLFLSLSLSLAHFLSQFSLFLSFSLSLAESSFSSVVTVLRLFNTAS